MVVNTTTNLGLKKPDETELAKNWALNTKLAEANNTIIVTEANVTVTSYSPSYIGPTTNPNVGTGSVVGEYWEICGFIFGNFTIIHLDAGISSGSGTGAYGISLPFPVDSVFHQVGTTLNDNPGSPSVIGEGYFNDASAVDTSGICAIDVVTISGVSYARLLPETYTGKTSRFVGPSAPVALATGDALSGFYVYKKA